MSSSHSCYAGGSWDFCGCSSVRSWLTCSVQENCPERPRDRQMCQFFLLDSFQCWIKGYIIIVELRFWREGFYTKNSFTFSMVPEFRFLESVYSYLFSSCSKSLQKIMVHDLKSITQDKMLTLSFGIHMGKFTHAYFTWKSNRSNCCGLLYYTQ